MTATTPYRLAPGVRFKREPSGAGVLLIPEGIVNLSESAAAIVAHVDGKRSVSEIAALLAEQFDDPHGMLANDVGELLANLRDCGYVRT